jgi:hypothetical protein
MDEVKRDKESSISDLLREVYHKDRPFSLELASLFGTNGITKVSSISHRTISLISPEKQERLKDYLVDYGVNGFNGGEEVQSILSNNLPCTEDIRQSIVPNNPPHIEDVQPNSDNIPIKTGYMPKKRVKQKLQDISPKEEVNEPEINYDSIDRGPYLLTHPDRFPLIDNKLKEMLGTLLIARTYHDIGEILLVDKGRIEFSQRKLKEGEGARIFIYGANSDENVSEKFSTVEYKSNRLTKPGGFLGVSDFAYRFSSLKGIECIIHEEDKQRFRNELTGEETRTLYVPELKQINLCLGIATKWVLKRIRNNGYASRSGLNLPESESSVDRIVTSFLEYRDNPRSS